MPNFIRCPNPNCDSGQVHEGGESQPVVTCAACNTEFCFRHRIPLQPQQQPPSQHENMSCDEYDQYLADPHHFRSDHQRQQERAAVERRELEVVQHARERMERVLQQRRAADGRKRRDISAREERERSRRALLEERRFQTERERAEQERRERADEIQRRRLEDEWSEQLIEVSTKGCPRCAKRIEKNEGCMHMTCPCGYEFCWECTGPWLDNSCANCFGGPVVQFD
ncbi:hypothetical protein Daus18300_009796 [Diaporthe australafricana]|uniref:RBR-type E3 ubiquitin transferase n=1 Tax=Diaporthe australafricana TaxID=127596 RepID=A0ABR3WCY5_9PEZI